MRGSEWTLPGAELNHEWQLVGLHNAINLGFRVDSLGSRIINSQAIGQQQCFPLVDRSEQDVGVREEQLRIRSNPRAHGVQMQENLYAHRYDEACARVFEDLIELVGGKTFAAIDPKS